MSPTFDNTPKLLGNAYDLSSCGIGTQRALVEMLAGARPESEYLQKQVPMGTKSNLLGGMRHHEDHLGEALSTFLDRRETLDQRWQGLERRALRLLFGESSSEATEDFDPSEYASICSRILGVADLPEGDAERLYDARYSETRTVAELTRLGISDDRFDAWADGINEQLASPTFADEMLRFHADKLQLMVDVFELDLRLSRAKPETRPEIGEGRLDANWRKLFDEEVPSAATLIENGKKAVKLAEER